MAAGTKIKIVYNTASGTTTHTWNHANADATDVNIRALASTTITNGAIFQKVPLEVKSITVETTTERTVNPS